MVDNATLFQSQSNLKIDSDSFVSFEFPIDFFAVIWRFPRGFSDHQTEQLQPAISIVFANQRCWRKKWIDMIERWRDQITFGSLRRNFIGCMNTSKSEPKLLIMRIRNRTWSLTASPSPTFSLKMPLSKPFPISTSPIHHLHPPKSLTSFHRSSYKTFYI